jgi:hypothetical protein
MLRLLNFSFNGDVRWVFFITNIKVGNSPVFVYQCRSVLENIKVTGHDLAYDVKIMTSQQRLSRIVTDTFL